MNGYGCRTEGLTVSQETVKGVRWAAGSVEAREHDRKPPGTGNCESIKCVMQEGKETGVIGSEPTM